MDKYKFCKPNQFFFQRNLILKYVEENGEYDFLVKHLMFGMLYRINGYLGRHKKYKTKDEVINWFIETLKGFEGDRMMHKYIEELRFIASLYK
jgi:hypothetical protein